jgi:hypothetical protein
VAIHALCAVLDAELANLTAVPAPLAQDPARGTLTLDPAAAHASPVRAAPDPLRRTA